MPDTTIVVNANLWNRMRDTLEAVKVIYAEEDKEYWVQFDAPDGRKSSGYNLGHGSPTGVIQAGMVAWQQERAKVLGLTKRHEFPRG